MDYKGTLTKRELLGLMEQLSQVLPVEDPPELPKTGYIKRIMYPNKRVVLEISRNNKKYEVHLYTY